MFVHPEKKKTSAILKFFFLLVGIFFISPALSGGRLEAVRPFHGETSSHAVLDLAQLGTCRYFTLASRHASGCGLDAQARP